MSQGSSNPFKDGNWVYRNLLNADQKAINAPVPPAQVVYLPGREQLFWQRVVGWVINPAKPWFLTHITAFMFIAPYTNITNFSLFYQMYLNQIVHRKIPTKVFHYLCTPFILLFVLACFAPVHIALGGQAGLGLDDGLTGKESYINGALVGALFLTVWYTIWGFIGKPEEKVHLMGPINVIPNALLWLGATTFYKLFRVPLSADEPVYKQLFLYTAHWYTSPVFLCLVFTFIQALSHAFEIYLPPRSTSYNKWVKLTSWIMLPNPISLGLRLLGIIMVTITGTLDEFLVTPRLWTMHNLRIANLVGYKSEQFRTVNSWAEAEYANSENPGLDYIGTGGGVYLWRALGPNGEAPLGHPYRPDLQGRLYDWIFLAFTLVWWALSLLFFVLPAFGPNDATLADWQAFQARAPWPPNFVWDIFYWYGENVDPLAISNPQWLSYLNLTAPLVSPWFFFFFVFAFIEGYNEMRPFGQLWTFSAVVNTVIILVREFAFTPEPLAPKQPILLIAFLGGLYVVVPLLLFIRFFFAFPIPEDEKRWKPKTK